MRFLAPVAVATLSGIVLWKLFATILLPFLGLVFGLMMGLFKIVLIVAVIYFIVSMMRKRRDEAQAA
jgi:uncharacterized membrane protein